MSPADEKEPMGGTPDTEAGTPKHGKPETAPGASAAERPGPSSETNGASEGEPRPRVQRAPNENEPSVFETAFEDARRAAGQGAAAVQRAVTPDGQHAMLLSTTMIAVGSAAVGALIGWFYARR